MPGTISRVVVYLSSSGHVAPEIMTLAQNCGQVLAQGGYDVVFGGMDLGPMGALASNTLQHGAKVIGIVPKKLRESAFVHKNLTRSLLVDTLAERKQLMFDLAHAVLILPGGFGTLDEAADILFWAALGLHNKPVIFVNPNGFWDDILALYHKVLAAYPDVHALVRTVATMDAALIELQKAGDVPRTCRVPYQSLPSMEDAIIAGAGPYICEGHKIEDVTGVIAALLCKQLNLTTRALGVVNDQGFYDPLFRYIARAAQEKMITEACLTLLAQANSRTALLDILDDHKHAEIDLAQKWGKVEAER